MCNKQQGKACEEPESYPFSTRMTRAQAAEILEKVKNVMFSDKNAGFSSEFKYYEMNSMKPLDRQLLVEKHLISPEFAEGQAERAAIISRDKRVSILVNEEDHLRLQCIYPECTWRKPGNDAMTLMPGLMKSLGSHLIK